MAKSKKSTKKPTKKTKKPSTKNNIPDESQSGSEPDATNQRQKYDSLVEQLSDKAGRFVQEYLIDLNKQKAAQRAGYSPRSSAQQACVLMKNPKVIAAINEGRRLIAERTMINQDEVIKELALIGFADMKDFIKIDDSGLVSAIPLGTMAEGKSRIIKKVREKRIIKEIKGTKEKPDGDMILEATFEFELHDKVKSLLGILDRVKPGADDPEKIEHTHNHKMTDTPPCLSIAEWEKQYHEQRAAAAKLKEGDK